MKTLEELKLLADAGNAEAKTEYKIRQAYDTLAAVPNILSAQEDEIPDLKSIVGEEAAYLEQLADQCDVQAQVVFAQWAMAGDDEEKTTKALQGLLDAANHGDTLAEVIIGYFYEYGASNHGIYRDYRKAFHFYSKAAEKGYVHAEYALGWFHEFIFLYHDYAKAISWYEKALEHGHADAAHRLGWLKQMGQLGTNLVSPGQNIIDWNQKGIQLMKEEKYDDAFLQFFNAACRGSEHDIGNVCHLLGQKKVKKDNVADALKLVQRYAYYNCAFALSFLSACYERGEYFPKSEKKHLEYAEKAAENGAMDCVKYLIARCLENGNYVGALKWNRKGYELGDVGCTYNLGIAYCQGQGVALDLEQGLKYLHEAKERDAASLGLPVDNAIIDFSASPKKGGCFGVILFFAFVVGATLFF